MDRVLSARKLTIGYRLSGSKRKVVHEDLNFSLREGELTSLLGANGVGKSTLIKSIARFVEPLSGDIELMGRPLESYSRASLAKVISVVLTDRIFDANLSVRDVISLGRYPYTGFFGRLSRVDHAIVEESAELTGVVDMLTRDIGSLSDGERQKVFIAKSLAQQTPLIVLDEPTAFLDIKSRIEIMGLLHSLASNQGKSILISTHDMDVALKLSDRVWTLKRGRGLLCGQTEDMVLSGSMSELFDGDNIDFDIDRATFVVSSKAVGRAVNVEGDATVLPWLRSALEREGYRIDSSSKELTIEAVSSDHYHIIYTNSHLKVTTIKEILENIRN